MVEIKVCSTWKLRYEVGDHENRHSWLHPCTRIALLQIQDWSYSTFQPMLQCSCCTLCWSFGDFPLLQTSNLSWIIWECSKYGQIHKAEMKLKEAIYEDIRSEVFSEQMHHDHTCWSWVKKNDVLATCSTSIIGINVNNPEVTRHGSETLYFDSTLMQLIVSDILAQYVRM